MGKIPINRTKPQNPHPIMQNLPRTLIKRHPGLLNLLLTSHYLKHIITRAQHVRHPEQVRQNRSRFESAGGVEEHVGPLGEQADEVDGVRLGEEIEVCFTEGGGVQPGFAGYGAEAGVGVLEVGACVAFEGGHGVEVEVVAVNTRPISNLSF